MSVGTDSKPVPQGRLFVFDRRNSVAVGDEGASPRIVQGRMEFEKLHLGVWPDRHPKESRCCMSDRFNKPKTHTHTRTHMHLGLNHSGRRGMMISRSLLGCFGKSGSRSQAYSCSIR